MLTWKMVLTMIAMTAVQQFASSPYCWCRKWTRCCVGQGGGSSMLSSSKRPPMMLLCPLSHSGCFKPPALSGNLVSPDSLPWRHLPSCVYLHALEFALNSCIPGSISLASGAHVEWDCSSTGDMALHSKLLLHTLKQVMSSHRLESCSSADNRVRAADKAQTLSASRTETCLST